MEKHEKQRAQPILGRPPHCRTRNGAQRRPRQAHGLRLSFPFISVASCHCRCAVPTRRLALSALRIHSHSASRGTSVKSNARVFPHRQRAERHPLSLARSLIAVGMSTATKRAVHVMNSHRIVSTESTPPPKAHHGHEKPVHRDGINIQIPRRCLLARFPKGFSIQNLTLMTIPMLKICTIGWRARAVVRLRLQWRCFCVS